MNKFWITHVRHKGYPPDYELQEDFSLPGIKVFCTFAEFAPDNMAPLYEVSFKGPAGTAYIMEPERGKKALFRVLTAKKKGQQYAMDRDWLEYYGAFDKWGIEE